MSQRLERLAQILAGVAGGLSLVVLLGYAAGQPTLLSPAPHAAATAVTTGSGMLLLSVAILMPKTAWRASRSALLVIVALAAGATLGSRIFLGTDHIGPWFAKWWVDDTQAAGRMSGAAALSLLCLCTASWWKEHQPVWADVSAGASLLISGTGLLGHIYGVEDLYALSAFNTLALPTALGLFLLSIAAMLRDTGSGLASIIASPDAGGHATRRQLLFTLLPPAAGWCLMRATELNLLGAHMAMALLVILTIVPLALLVLRDGRTVTSLERERQAKAALQAAHLGQLNKRLAQQADELETEHQRRLAAESRVQDAQRMETLGRLSGGIAHDFNNVLMSISGNLQLLRKRLPQPDLNQRFVDNALASTHKGAKIAGQLLAFSRTQKLHLQAVAVQPVLERAHEMMRHALGPGVRVVLSSTAPDAWVVADPDQLELALMNLALNAGDAMPDGGVIQLGSGWATDRQASGDFPGPWVVIRMVDPGLGMSAEVLAKATEPFFTTKERGKGTGLGLAQVYGFARQCHGDLRIYSAPDHGTTVELLLPATAPVQASPTFSGAEAAPVEPNSAHSPAPSVLVIDDDEHVRHVIVQALTDAGFDVAEAADGVAGLAALEHHRPSAAVIDFLMPGMNGAEVARRAQQRYPGLPIVFVSGYSDTVALDGIAGAVVLRKPFDVHGLSQALHAVLH